MRPQTQKAGHLPGAIRIDWEELLDEGNRSRLKGAKALEKVFADQEVVRDKDVAERLREQWCERGQWEHEQAKSGENSACLVYPLELNGPSTSISGRSSVE
jgi:hypothetical protein